MRGELQFPSVIVLLRRCTHHENTALDEHHISHQFGKQALFADGDFLGFFLSLYFGNRWLLNRCSGRCCLVDSRSSLSAINLGRTLLGRIIYRLGLRRRTGKHIDGSTT